MGQGFGLRATRRVGFSMKLLIERIEGWQTDRHIILPPRLDIKGSTGPAPKSA